MFKSFLYLQRLKKELTSDAISKTIAGRIKRKEYDEVGVLTNKFTIIMMVQSIANHVFLSK